MELGHHADISKKLPVALRRNPEAVMAGLG
jgi:hypothetical protein